MDPVNPKHYRQGGIECIDAIESAFTNSEMTALEAFCTGNALKYLWRWKHKGGHEDLLKAKWYIDRILAPSKEDEKTYMVNVNLRVDDLHDQLVAMGVKDEEPFEDTNNAHTHILVCKICSLPADVYEQGKIGCDRCDRKEYVVRRRSVNHFLSLRTGDVTPVEWWPVNGEGVTKLKTFHVDDIMAALLKGEKSGFVVGKADDGGRRNGIKWRCFR